MTQDERNAVCDEVAAVLAEASRSEWPYHDRDAKTWRYAIDYANRAKDAGYLDVLRRINNERGIPPITASPSA